MLNGHRNDCSRWVCEKCGNVHHYKNAPGACWEERSVVTKDAWGAARVVGGHRRLLHMFDPGACDCGACGRHQS